MKLFNDCCENIIKSIAQCIKGKYFIPSLILIYSGIDIMSWFNLPITQEEAQGKDFVDWVEKYLLLGSKLECSGIDLYAARCSIVHSYSFESRKTKKGEARRIYYAWGNGRVEDLKKIILFHGENAIAVHINDLFNDFKQGIEGFRTDVKISFEKNKAVYEKEKKFIFTDIFTKNRLAKMGTFNTYDEILNKLSDVEEWIKSFRLKIDNTLLGNSKKNLVLINDLFLENRINELNKFIDNTEGIESIFTCSEFNYVYDNLRDYKNKEELTLILKESLGESSQPVNEIERNKDITKSYFFQLELASFIKERGFQIENLDDIGFSFSGCKFNIKCIRPFLEKNMKDNILYAYSQLTERLKKNEKGIIAIAVDKMMSIEDKILSVKNLTNVVKEENNIINEIENKYRDIWLNFLNINIIGIILFVKFKFKPREGVITLRRGLHFYPLYPSQEIIFSQNKFLIDKIAPKLEAPIIIENFILPDFSSYL